MTKLIIFDWDGTLCDSVARIASCIQLAAAENQMEVPSKQAAADIIGLAFLRLQNAYSPVSKRGRRRYSLHPIQLSFVPKTVFHVSFLMVCMKPWLSSALVVFC
jgi:phosphoglycolate phosphatase